MKTLIIIFFFTFTFVNAQIVNIPDVNFKNALYYLNVDTNNDGEIQVSEAEAVNGMLDLYHSGGDILGFGISDLTGIEAFVNITGLNCSNNFLQTIDLTSNSNLIQLFCNDNYTLNILNITNNSNLEDLSCAGNILSELDLHNNINLTSIDCSSNLLTTLNLINGTNTSINNFFATNNPNLTCIFVDNASYSQTHWTNIDPNSHFVESQAQCNQIISVNDYSLNAFKIYPNPVTNNNLMIENNSGNNFKIQIFNTLGNLVIDKRILLEKENIDISSLNKGVYFVKYNKRVQKIIKQ